MKGFRELEELLHTKFEADLVPVQAARQKIEAIEQELAAIRSKREELVRSQSGLAPSVVLDAQGGWETWARQRTRRLNERLALAKADADEVERRAKRAFSRYSVMRKLTGR